MKSKNTNQSYSYVIGIDVSKQSLDVCMVHCDNEQKHSKCFANNSEGFIALKKWIKNLGNHAHENTLFCMEHTGIYTRNLIGYLISRDAKVWVESSLHIKRSMGLARGKSDKIDAIRIASFALRHQRDAKPIQLAEASVTRLKDLHVNRIRLKKSLSILQIPLQEMKEIDPTTGKMLEKANKNAVSGIESSIEKIEELILSIINSDENLKRLFELVTSIKGEGKIMGLELLVYTHGFTRIMDGRKLACYTGVAPFEYSSGTSINGGSHPSNFANRMLKHTLHLCAMNSIRYNEEMRTYYERKVAEGKKRMSVLNAVRNKILHRVVAVVKRGTPYVEKLN